MFNTGIRPPVFKYCFICHYKPLANTPRNNAWKKYLMPEDEGMQREIRRGTDAKAPGNGVILMRFYISDGHAALYMLRGDGRGPTPELDAPYRIAIAWDTDSGDVSFSVTNSCTTFDLWCPGQDQIRKGGANTMEVTGAKTGHLSVTFGGLNSILPCCSVEGKASVDINGGRTTIKLQGDDYPDFEAFRYTAASMGPRLAWDDTNGAGGQAVPQYPWDRDVTFVDGMRQ